MVLNKFDSVKVIAMGNYSRRRKLKWLFEFFVFLILVFHWSSLFSLTVSVIRHFFRGLVVVLNSHIFVFVVFHAMLFIIYTLSPLTDNKFGSNRSDTQSGLDGRPSHLTAVAHGGDSPESLVAPREDFVDEILVVGVKNTTSFPSPVDDSVAGILVVSEKNTATVNEVSIDANSIEERTTTPSPASVRHFNSLTKMTEIRQYQRTESERFEGNREMGKLRRSKTVIHWETGGEAARFFNSVDEMDIDDFNRTVESFIAEQKFHIGGRIFG